MKVRTSFIPDQQENYCGLELVIVADKVTFPRSFVKREKCRTSTLGQRGKLRQKKKI